MIDILEPVDGDGFPVSEARIWAKRKYRLLALYIDMFTNATKNKWDSRAYVDLFAGAGLAEIEETKEIVRASPLIALSSKTPFDKVVLCEADPNKFESLDKRIRLLTPSVDVSLVHGDANENTEKILQVIPQHRSGFRVLSFCFVDPYKAASLKFSTIRTLANNKRMDFLVLIPTGMDINRNLANYLRKTNTTLDEFLGTDAWRPAWDERKRPSEHFGVFIADFFGKQMESIGYQYLGPDKMLEIRGTEKNVSLYHLAFFSKSGLGVKFWNEARKYESSQLSLLSE